jgi:serine/threonine-protein kinase SRK2
MICRWYFQQLIIALDYIHKMAVGHRDLKLENVLLAHNPDNPYRHILKLADFGFAANHVNTVANSKVGTYSYMAPEVG